MIHRVSIFLARLREVKSKSTFGSDNKLDDDEVTFISIHVRRTDYAGFLSTFVNLSLADETYFNVATDYFRKRYKVFKYINRLFQEKIQGI